MRKLGILSLILFTSLCITITSGMEMPLGSMADTTADGGNWFYHISNEDADAYPNWSYFDFTIYHSHISNEYQFPLSSSGYMTETTTGKYISNFTFLAYNITTSIAKVQIEFTDWNAANYNSLGSGCYHFALNFAGGPTNNTLQMSRCLGYTCGNTIALKRAGSSYGAPRISGTFIYYPTGYPTPAPTPYPDNIAVNILEKYSNAALVGQSIEVNPVSGGAGEKKTSIYGETLHFGVIPGAEYWFNASRAGYQDYNETYTIPASPGIYNVYMERILTPIANHSYAHFSVVDQTNGGLIPNAEIRLSDGQTKLTNSAGYAWFSVNNSEQINYYVSKPSGYWPAYGAMNLTADESILVALQRYTGPTATATMPGWTPVTVPTTGTGVDPVVTLSAQLRQQNVQEGMDVWYTNLPFISQFLFLLFIIGGLGLMAGGTRRN
jgi:hypothetical protein